MSGFLILGAGGHGLVLADVALALGKWDSIAFLDDRYQDLEDELPGPVLGGMRTLDQWRGRYPDIVVAIGDAGRRLELLERAVGLGYRLPALVHPTAWVSPSVVLGAGTVVMAQAAVQAAATLGRGCIVNTGACVDHHCQLGDGVHVAPNAALGGNVSVGARTWIGLGAAVREGMVIGSDVLVAAGAVVVAAVADGTRVMGTPARVRGTTGSAGA